MNPPGELIDDLRLLEAPDPWRIYYILGGSIAALLLIWVLWQLIRRWRRKYVENPAREIRAAQEDALAALQQLAPLVAAGESRFYAVESSAVIRRYIERRFQLRAPTRSTEEFLHEAQESSHLAEQYRELLGQFLGCCDFLKFARGLATQAELEELHASAVTFVTETRAVEGGAS